MKPKLPPSRLLVTAIAISLCGIWFDRNVIHPSMRIFAGLRNPSLMVDVDPNPSSLSDGNDNDAPTIATNDATAPITTSRNAVATTSNSCGDVLDALDTKFNERRAARQNHPDYNQFGGGKKMFDLYEPEATCLTEERFGSKSGTRYSAYGDGPKFICGVDLIATKAKKSDGKGCLVYSIGSNNDIAFEKAVFTTMPGCEIHTFDPTLEDVGFVGDEYSTFHPWGLGTDGGKEGSTMHSRKKVAKNLSFQSVLRELGHSNRTIDVLKIDCKCICVMIYNLWRTACVCYASLTLLFAM